MSGQMQYRLPVSSLDETHMKTYANVIRSAKALQDNRGFYHYAGIHGAPGRWCWHHQFSQHTNLSARIFLPWHRAYLHRLEQALQDIDSTTAIPWWDWTSGPNIPASFSTSSIDDGDNPLYQSHVRLSPPQVPNQVDFMTSRNPAPQLPAFTFPVADVNQDGRATLAELVDYLVESVTTFEQFNDLLESVHDQIHGHVGGTMGSVTYAAYDPIFYSHHCMIDRIWWLWQKRHGVDSYPIGLKDVVLEPFGLTAGEVLNVQSLGYEYATSVEDIPIVGTDLERVS